MHNFVKTTYTRTKSPVWYASTSKMCSLFLLFLVSDRCLAQGGKGDDNKKQVQVELIQPQDADNIQANQQEEDVLGVLEENMAQMKQIQVPKEVVKAPQQSSNWEIKDIIIGFCAVATVGYCIYQWRNTSYHHAPQLKAPKQPAAQGQQHASQEIFASKAAHETKKFWTQEGDYEGMSVLVESVHALATQGIKAFNEFWIKKSGTAVVQPIVSQPHIAPQKTFTKQTLEKTSNVLKQGASFYAPKDAGVWSLVASGLKLFVTYASLKLASRAIIEHRQGNSVGDGLRNEMEELIGDAPNNLQDIATSVVLAKGYFFLKDLKMLPGLLPNATIFPVTYMGAWGGRSLFGKMGWLQIIENGTAAYLEHNKLYCPDFLRALGGHLMKLDMLFAYLGCKPMSFLVDATKAYAMVLTSKVVANLIAETTGVISLFLLIAVVKYCLKKYKERQARQKEEEAKRQQAIIEEKKHREALQKKMDASLLYTFMEVLPEYLQDKIIAKMESMAAWFRSRCMLAIKA